jgi:serine/threonine protein kinase
VSKDSVVYRGSVSSYRVKNMRPFAYGRFSVLFEGIDVKGTVVCVKVFRASPDLMDVNSLREFTRELDARKYLLHDNLLPILDYGEDASGDPALFLVMPFCDAGNLRTLMRASTFVPRQQALPILRQVAACLDYAHEKGIVHGDIKPENVLFQRDHSRALVSDFGISRHFSRDSQTTSPSPIDEGGGTVAYMSPEQLAEAVRSPASDIYSFTTMAYEVLTGHLPFKESLSFNSLIQAKLKGELIEAHNRNPRLPKSISAVLMKGLSVSPLDRPQSAVEICTLLANPDAIILAPAPQRGILRRFAALEPANKTAIIVAGISSIAALAGALVKILPELWK